MRCVALRPFAYSLNGIDSHRAKAGDHIEIPDDQVSGLLEEGYVADLAVKAVARSPERKVIEMAPENKARGRGGR